MSEVISLALRKAVSPDVIGAKTTPSMARIAPAVPSHWLQIASTTPAGVQSPAFMKFSSFSYGVAPSVLSMSANLMDAAAHISATSPSVIIAP